MKPIPYGSPPPLPDERAGLRSMVLAQREQMLVAQGDITELKGLARRLNAKYETEQKRLRQLQEDIVLSNARAHSITYQNEDLRQRMQHIEAFGIEQRHMHTVRIKPSADSVAVAVAGLAAIVGMFLMLLYAVAETVG